MRALGLTLLLLCACISGEDETNCLPISCSGCCAVDGTCQVGTQNAQCGAKGARCVDCTKSNSTCNASAQQCR